MPSILHLLSPSLRGIEKSCNSRKDFWIYRRESARAKAEGVCIFYALGVYICVRAYIIRGILSNGYYTRIHIWRGGVYYTRICRSKPLNSWAFPPNFLPHLSGAPICKSQSCGAHLEMGCSRGIERSAGPMYGNGGSNRHPNHLINSSWVFTI